MYTAKQPGSPPPAMTAAAVCDRRFVAHCRQDSALAERRYRLRHDREREIISVAPGVACLEVIAVDGDDRPIGQIAEGAADGIGARVTD
jgi:hypothetical protein